MLKTLIRLLVIIGLPIVAGVSTYSYISNNFIAPVDSNNKKIVLVDVPQDSTFRSLCKDLEKKELIKHWRVLDVLARLKRNDKEIKAGEYEISANMSPSEILTKLASGDVYKRSVTIPEGSNLWDIARIIEKAGVISSEEFLKAVFDRALLNRAGIRGDSFEGYLYPETYNFSKGTSVKSIIFTMLEEGESKDNWPEGYNQQMKVLNLSKSEVLILASIIEKESGNVEEQPKISSVFHNRMNLVMKLQSDPTVIYGTKKFGEPITQKDLDTPHAYNTYVNFGLPVGPICNPGPTAIKAALFPEETKYLFFVADGNGSHVFTKTYNEHKVAVQDYRAKIKSQNQETVKQ